MTREERQQFLDKHPILRDWYMDDERYGDGKGLSSGAETLGKMAIAADGARGIASGSKIANAVFVPVTGKFVAKKTHDLARRGHKETLENVADGVETASALYGLGAGAAGKVLQTRWEKPMMCRRCYSLLLVLRCSIRWLITDLIRQKMAQRTL